MVSHLSESFNLCGLCALNWVCLLTFLGRPNSVAIITDPVLLSPDPQQDPSTIATEGMVDLHTLLHQTLLMCWGEEFIFPLLRFWHNVSPPRLAIVVRVCFGWGFLCKQSTIRNHISLKNRPRCYTKSVWAEMRPAQWVGLISCAGVTGHAVL